VEDGEDADLCTEMLGIGGDGEGGFGGRLEQQVVDDGLVLIGDVADWRRQGVDHMEVRHGQQLGLALGQPFPGCGSLTLGAMAVAAGVVGDDGVGAALAACDMAAERSRAAALDRRHHLELVEADMAGIGLPPCRTMVAEDVRDLERQAGHGRRVLRRRWAFLIWIGLLAGLSGRLLARL